MKCLEADRINLVRDLLLHPKTKVQIENICRGLPHAVLLYGPTGTGKYTVGQDMAKRILGTNNLDSYPYFLEIVSDKAIGIEAAHAMQYFLSKKTTGNGSIRRIILIADAHTMTNEAQNALLKTVEEPPADTLLIMTSNSLPAIKATIRSRVQHVEVLPVDHQAAQAFFKDKDITSAYSMSDGRAGLLAALLKDEAHPLVEGIKQAKTILGMTSYERLCITDTLAKEKGQLYLLLEGMERVALSGMRAAASQQQKSKAEKFLKLNQALALARKQLDASTNPKLVMTNLFLKF